MRCETLPKIFHAELPTFPLPLKTKTQADRSNVRKLNLDWSEAAYKCYCNASQQKRTSDTFMYFFLVFR